MTTIALKLWKALWLYVVILCLGGAATYAFLALCGPYCFGIPA
jgi:hypothetical protein